MTNLQKLKENRKKIQNATQNIRSFVENIIDEASFVETDAFLSSNSFFDGVEALGEGVLTGTASIGGRSVAVIAENSDVLGGSMSRAHADKILKLIGIAIERNLPVISVLDSTGARIAEGVSVLEGYADVISAAMDLNRCVPHIAVIKGNAVGLNGIFAETADFVFMSNDGVISLNPPKSVISRANENASATELLGSSALSENGLAVTATYDDYEELRRKMSFLLDYFTTVIVENNDSPNRTLAALNKNHPVDTVLNTLVDKGSVVEFYSGYEKGVFTGLATINGVVAGVVATNYNGESEKISVNQVKKLTKFIKLTSSFEIPLVTILDSEGFDSCLKCEQKGIVNEIAELIRAVNDDDNHKICVITGKAVGAAYVALASKGMGFHTFALPDAYVSPVTSCMAVDVLEDSKEYASASDPIKLKEKLVKKYEEDFANPFIALKEGYVDDVIEPALVRPYVANVLLTMFEEK